MSNINKLEEWRVAPEEHDRIREWSVSRYGNENFQVEVIVRTRKHTAIYEFFGSSPNLSEAIDEALSDFVNDYDTELVEYE